MVGQSAATCGSTFVGLQGEVDRNRQYAAELVALAPDVILAAASGVPALKQATRTVPIVFTIVADPVGLGFVDSMARPRGNITGFLAFEYGISGKWLELLKQVATGRDASCSRSRSRDCNRCRAVCRRRVRGAGARRGHRSQLMCAIPARWKTHCRGIRALGEWWPGRDGQCVCA